MRFDPSQNVSDPEHGLILRPRASRIAAALLILMGLLALVSISLSGLLAGLPRLLFLLLTLLMAGLALFRLDRHRPRQIALSDTGLRITTGHGVSISIRDCRHVFLSPWYLGALGLDGRGQRVFRLTLFRDQLDREAYRQLSAWFRQRQE